LSLYISIKGDKKQKRLLNDGALKGKKDRSPFPNDWKGASKL
jgi:hypothetical protein